MPYKMRQDTPKHYNFEIEPIEAIASWGLNFNTGNVVKYVVRAGRKNPDEHLVDLRKALDYLQAEIEFIETAKNKNLTSQKFNPC